MSLASLFNMPETDEALSVFAFSNQDQHRQIVAAIARRSSLTLPLFPLDPIPMFEPGVWAHNHQQMHNDFNAILGIAGSDLTAVDFRNPQELASWIRLHGSEHQQAANILGLS